MCLACSCWLTKPPVDSFPAVPKLTKKLPPTHSCTYSVLATLCLPGAEAVRFHWCIHNQYHLILWNPECPQQERFCRWPQSFPFPPQHIDTPEPGISSVRFGCTFSNLSPTSLLLWWKRSYLPQSCLSLSDRVTCWFELSVRVKLVIMIIPCFSSGIFPESSEKCIVS